MRGGRLEVAVVILVIGVSLLALSTRAAPPRFKPSGLVPTGVALPTLVRQGLVLPMGTGNAPDALQVGYPSVLVDHGVYKMWYFEVQPSPWFAQIAYATSVDGRTWTKYGAVLSPSLAVESFDVAYPTVALVNGTYWMWYDGYDGSVYRILAATSPDGVSWTKHGVVLDLGPSGSQDSGSLGDPFVVYDQGTFKMWYTGLTGFTGPDNGAIMFATSTNGLNWTKAGVVLAPGAAGSIDSYNVQTSGVVKVGTTFVMLYTGIDANVTGRLLWAESSDGLTWTKEGVALAPDPPAERGIGSATPVVLPDGTWMVYYGVRNYTSDIQVYLATSGGASSPRPGPTGPILLPGFAALVALVSPMVAVAFVTLCGAAVGAGLGAVWLRIRRR